MDRGYDANWQAVRDEYARAHPHCEDHLERGQKVPLELVDHVIPLPHGPRLDPRNLRSLCRSCHSLKSARDRAAGYEANSVAQLAGDGGDGEGRWLMR